MSQSGVRISILSENTSQPGEEVYEERKAAGSVSGGVVCLV